MQPDTGQSGMGTPGAERLGADRGVSRASKVPASSRGNVLLGAFLDAALDIGLGRACAGCGRPGRQVCPDCLAAMSGWTPAGSTRPGLGRIVAATRYEGLAARLLVAHKDRGAVGLSRPLGRVLARAVLAVLHEDAASPRTGRGAPVLLVPVPSSAASRRRRGYDHTLRVARAAGRELRREGVDARAAPVLVRAHAVRDQASLGLGERARNQRGSMRVREGGWRRLRTAAPGTRVVVVDDIVTTGATVREALRALAPVLQGAEVAGVAAVAQTPRRVVTGGVPVVSAGPNHARIAWAHTHPV